MAKKIMELSKLVNIIKAYINKDSEHIKTDELSKTLREKASEFDIVEPLFNLYHASYEYRHYAFIALQSLADYDLLPEDRIETLLMTALKDWPDRDEFYRCFSCVVRNQNYLPAIMQFVNNLLEWQGKSAMHTHKWRVHSEGWIIFHVISDILIRMSLDHRSGHGSNYEKFFSLLTEEFLLKLFREALKEEDRDMQLGFFELLGALSNIYYYDINDKKGE